MSFTYYFMRLKCLLYNKGNIFWTLFFPIGLAIIFNFAFSNIMSSQEFDTVNVGVVEVEQTENDYNADLGKIMEEATLSDGKKMFEVTRCSVEEAKEMLTDGKIDGYIVSEKDFQLYVSGSGIKQTIIKSFLESFEQISNTMERLIRKTMAETGKIPTEDEVTAQVQNLMEEYSVEKDYKVDNLGNGKSPNTILNYFYALLAMACLFGSYWGSEEIQGIQADQSANGARINVAPVHKMKLLLCNLSAAYTIQLAEIIIVIAFLKYVLKIDFGNNIGYVFLICILGCSVAITLGAMVTILLKGNQYKKQSILTAVTLVGSFLSGLMIVEVKYMVATKAPWLMYINPASLVSDAFYSLYYYDNYDKYFLNITLLALYTILFGAITYFIARRQQYASI